MQNFYPAHGLRAGDPLRGLVTSGLCKAEAELVRPQRCQVQNVRTRVVRDPPRKYESATKTHRNDCSFWQYKVYTDIRGGSLETRRQTTVG